jgi:formate hydrogenlyase subunit 6/NADH:ubiquinone oxidoreductase subunit I
MANTLDEILGSAAGIAKGMGVTFKEMMSPTVTENYPDGPAKLEERYRGVHVLQRDANGLEKCVACFLCAAACPSNCIYIEAAENTDKKRISGGERYAKVITSITTAVSSADTAWRLAPPMPSPMATDLRCRAITPPRW